MSTTQELIERLKAAPDYVTTNWPKLTDEAATRLSELSAELDALRGKLEGVDEKALEAAWRQYVTSQAREAGDHRTFSEEQWARVRQGNPPAYSRLRAAITAYLAALGG